MKEADMRNDDSNRQQGSSSNEGRQQDQFTGDSYRQRQHGDMGGHGDSLGRAPQGGYGMSGDAGRYDEGRFDSRRGGWGADEGRSADFRSRQFGSQGPGYGGYADERRYGRDMGRFGRAGYGGYAGGGERGDWSDLQRGWGSEGSNDGGLNPGRGGHDERSGLRSSGFGRGEQRGDDQQFDPDYHQWRSEQMRNLDDDYREWRQDRYKKFSDEFTQWRKNRPQQRGSSSASQESGSSNKSNKS
jgi:hypothetical protein